LFVGLDERLNKGRRRLFAGLQKDKMRLLSETSQLSLNCHSERSEESPLLKIEKKRDSFYGFRITINNVN
jgi:hypothetical protein